MDTVPWILWVQEQMIQPHKPCQAVWFGDNIKTTTYTNNILQTNHMLSFTVSCCNNNNIFISYIKYTNITPPANSKANRGRWCVDGLRFITNS